METVKKQPLLSGLLILFLTAMIFANIGGNMFYQQNIEFEFPILEVVNIRGVVFTDLGNAWLQMPWMHVKLGFVFLLYLYHLKCHQIYGQLQRDEVKHTSNFMRLWNEGATIILFAVVFLVILKNAVNWIYGVVGIFLFSILIMLGFKMYKRIREKNQS